MPLELSTKIAAADLGGIIEAVPQLALVAHNQGFAVEGRPDFGIGRVGAEFLDDLVPKLAASCADFVRCSSRWLQWMQVKLQIEVFSITSCGG